MKIAVFARALDSRPTGRGVVVRELLDSLGRVRPDIEVDLFASADPGWSGVTFHPTQGSSALGGMARMLAGVANDVKRLRPDALWCATHLVPIGLPSGLPQVVTLLDVVWRDQPTSMNPLNRWVSRYAEKGLQRATRIVCISEFTRRRLAFHWPDLEARARVVRPAPSTALIGVDNPTSLAIGGAVVASVGTLEPRKNMGVLLDAIQRLPGTSLVHCGKTGWKVDGLIRKAHGVPNVHLLGYADSRIVNGLYRGSAVAAFPSLYEGFHLPPLEAMALGCPVVASDIPVHREVLGDAAAYVASNEPDEWAEALRRVIGNPVERSRMVAAGLARAQNYSWDAAALALADIIEQAVASP